MRYEFGVKLASHTTEKEIAFLAKLGTHGIEGSTPYTRLELLQGYQKSMELRYDWDAMDPAKIATVVETMVEQEKEEKRSIVTEFYN